MGRWVFVFAPVAFAVACASFKSAGDGADGGASSGGESSSGGQGSSGGGSSTSSGSAGSSSGTGASSSSGVTSSSGSTSSSSGTSGSSNGSSGSSGGDGGTATGPGPFGALPSGYCCAASTDCRNRNCVDLGGGNKMCEDECDGFPAICTGILTGFTCLPDDGGVSSYCMPASGATPCVPASQYTHGTKPTGACCTPLSDGTNGRECLGGNCGSTGAQTNPYSCENTCDTTHPCTGEFMCQNIADYDLCLPVNPATCTQ